MFRSSGSPVRAVRAPVQGVKADWCSGVPLPVLSGTWSTGRSAICVCTVRVRAARGVRCVYVPGVFDRRQCDAERHGKQDERGRTGPGGCGDEWCLSCVGSNEGEDTGRLTRRLAQILPVLLLMVHR